MRSRWCFWIVAGLLCLAAAFSGVYERGWYAGRSEGIELGREQERELWKTAAAELGREQMAARKDAATEYRRLSEKFKDEEMVLVNKDYLLRLLRWIALGPQ